METSISEFKSATPAKSSKSNLAPPANFRLHLQDQLLKRCEKNPGYSLRSFAKTLQINPSSLSRILRGERPLSPKMVNRLGQILGMSPIEIKRYKENEKDRSNKGSAQIDYERISADTFAVISDWYHYAILELCSIHHFEMNAKSIAKALSITVTEANVAIERLIRLDMLKADKEGKLYDASGPVTNIGTDMRAAALKKLQRQVLELALKALDETPLEKRNQTSMTMAVDSRKLPEAIKKITAFRRELCAFLEDSSNRDQVYNLSVSLHPLTKIPNPEIPFNPVKENL